MHPAKVLYPILITLSGMVIEAIAEQSLKALSAINRVFSLIVYTPDIDVFALIK